MKDIKWLFDTPIAHRGLHNKDIAENSITAYKAAIDKGYNIEIDVHMSSDGELLVFHDYSLERVCGIDKKISTISTKELNNYKLSGTEDIIPTLKEVLELIDGKVGLLIEIKYRFDNVYKNIAEKVYESVKDYKGKVAIQSFSPFVMKWFKYNAPDMIRGLLATAYDDMKLPSIIKKSMKGFSRLIGKKVIGKLQLDFIAYNILSFPSPIMEFYKSKGMPLLTWTVRKIEDIDKAKKYADNIIFENLEIAVQYIK